MENTAVAIKGVDEGKPDAKKKAAPQKASKKKPSMPNKELAIEEIKVMEDMDNTAVAINEVDDRKPAAKNIPPPKRVSSKKPFEPDKDLAMVEAAVREEFSQLSNDNKDKMEEFVGKQSDTGITAYFNIMDNLKKSYMEFTEILRRNRYKLCKKRTTQEIEDMQRWCRNKRKML